MTAPHHRRAGVLLRLAVAVALTLVADVALGSGASPVAAESSGGATSRVVGRGDIVTAILANTTSTGRPTKGSRPSTDCRWITFTDGQTEYLVAIAAAEAGRPDHRPVFDVLLAQADTDAFATSDLQGRYCDGVTVELRLVPRAEGVDVPTALARRMITHLPAPELVTSPPEASALPLGEPVFVSSAPSAWRPVEASLSAGDVVAEVRATPIAIRTFVGEPDAPMRQCDGPGVAYSPLDPTSPTVQAARPGVCSLDYRLPTRHADGSPVESRPTSWIGTVTVVWAAEWRVAPGPWRSLGLVPRTRLIRRAVTEVTTSLSSRRP